MEATIPSSVDEFLRIMGERSLRESVSAKGARLDESTLTPQILLEAGKLWCSFYSSEVRLLAVAAREALARYPDLGEVLEAYTTRVIGLPELGKFLSLPTQQLLQVFIAENSGQPEKLREVLELFVALDELR